MGSPGMGSAGVRGYFLDTNHVSWAVSPQESWHGPAPRRLVWTDVGRALPANDLLRRAMPALHKADRARDANSAAMTQSNSAHHLSMQVPPQMAPPLPRPWIRIQTAERVQMTWL